MKLTRRALVAGVGAAAATIGLAGLYRPQPQPKIPGKKHPNVVIFIADDLRYDTLGFSGNPIVQTPVLDTLSKRSFVFANHFTTSSVCAISRASMLTGMFWRNHHVTYSHYKLAPRLINESYPVMLRNAGYHTGLVGKWGIGNGPKRLFDSCRTYPLTAPYVSSDGVHITDTQTSDALAFLSSAPKDKSFMLLVSYRAPHTPFVPQKKFDGLYKDVPIPRAASDTQEAHDALPPLLKKSRGAKQYIKHGYPSEEAYTNSLRRYYQLVTGIDESVGKILDALDMSQTIVLFTSDNGFMLGEHRMQGKWCMYEESIRAPLIISLPEAYYQDVVPRRIESATLNIDIAQTIIDLALGKVSPIAQGKSVLKLMQNAKTDWRKEFFYEYPFIASGGMIGAEGFRTDNWKYTRYFANRKTNECLFDLNNDPNELHNLAGNAHHQVLKEMRRKVAQTRRELKLAGKKKA